MSRSWRAAALVRRDHALALLVPAATSDAAKSPSLELPGGQGQALSIPDRRAQPAVRRPEDRADRGAPGGREQRQKQTAARQRRPQGEPGDGRPGSPRQLHDGGFDPTIQLLQSPTRSSCWTGVDHAAARSTSRPGQRACSHRPRAPPTGPSRPRSSRRQGHQLPRHEQEGRPDPGQGERAEQLGVHPGPGRLPADRALPQHPITGDSLASRRWGRADQDRRPVRLGRRRARPSSTARAW